MESRARLSLLMVTAALFHGAGAAAAKTYETRDAALARVFGADAVIDRRTAFLTPAQVDAAQRLAGARIGYPRVTYYVATHGDSLLGRAYLDTHIVRTLNETLLVVVGPDGRTRGVDILAFDEPEDYLPPRRWLHALAGRTLSKQLRPGDGVDAISGATLSARAATEAVRRVLAVDQVLHGGSR
jgi:transcriptional regulator of nitric oxide reductase